MLIPGVIHALTGRFGARRSVVILATPVFIGAGAQLAKMAMAAGY